MQSDPPNRPKGKARPPAWLGAAVASAGLHAATVVALPALAPRLQQPAPSTIELAVVPAPAAPQPALPEPQLEPAAPVPVARARPSRPPPTAPRLAPETRPPEAPPPAPVPEAPPPVEVVGIDPDPAADGELALPAGDTLLGEPSTGSPPGPRRTSEATGGPTEGSSSGQPAGAAAFLPVGPGQIRQMPSILKEIQVAYPERARMLEIEGTVLLSVGVDEKGLTREVRVLRGIGYGLDEAATQALRDFRWRPALGHDGRPVPVRLTYSYRFRVPR